MTSAEWETFRRLSLNERLYANLPFMTWLWNGHAPTGELRADSRGLSFELKSLAWIAANHLYGRDEVTERRAWGLVRRAVNIVRSQEWNALLGQAFQRKAAEIVCEIEEQGFSPDQLQTPEFCFREIGREILLKEIERLCNIMRVPDTPIYGS
jgi:hypothetical protein